MGKRIKHYFINCSLRKKIILMAFGTALTSLLCCVLFAMVYYNTAHKRNLNQQIDDNLNMLSSQLDTQFNDTVLCSNYLTLSINQIESQSDDRFYKKYDQVTSLLSGTQLIFNGIDSIVYMDKAGYFYSTSPELTKKTTAINQSAYYRNLASAKNGKTHLFNMNGDCMYRNADTPVITMGKKVIALSSGETLGYLFINISVDYLENLSNTDANHYYLYDTTGKCIHTDLDEFYQNTAETFLAKGKSSRTIHYQGSYYAARETILENWGWRIVSVTDLDAYYLNIYQFIAILSFTMLVVLLMLLLLSSYVTSILTKPLNLLTKGAEEIAAGNLDVRFDFKSRDDIGRMGQVFNHMAEEISLLIHRVDEEAASKRSYELALIQEQVKPHFLYNSLDIIMVLIEMGKHKEATRVTRKLAEYYRNSLSSSAEFIPLAKEFQIIEDYLDLQLMRYQDNFTYSLNLPKEYGDVMIPKLTLQPLVENALYHGLKENIEWGNIDVSATPVENTLRITISDNGLGMTQKTLAELQDPNGAPDKHFGVYSVRHRLELYYPGTCDFQIASKFNEGTTITITLPLTNRDVSIMSPCASQEEQVHA